MPFRLSAANRRHGKRRQDEKTPCEKMKRRIKTPCKKTKRRIKKKQKDEITPCEKTKLTTRKQEFSARKDEIRHAKRRHLKL